MFLLFFGIVVTFSSSIVCDKAPTIFDNSTTWIDAKEGESVLLECYASGSPTPQILWMKGLTDDVASDFTREFTDNFVTDVPSDLTSETTTIPPANIIYYGNALNLSSVTKDQNGRYICRAENKIGIDMSVYHLNIHFAPKITQIQRAYNFNKKSIKLGCFMAAGPLSSIIWFKNNKVLNVIRQRSSDDWNNSVRVITIDNKYNITEPYRRYFNGGKFSVLTISTKENDYHGHYKCVIENKLGKAEETFNICKTKMSNSTI